MAARRFEHQVLALALLAGAPGSVAALLLLWLGDHSDRLRWTLTLLIPGLWIGLSLALRRNVVRPLQTLANMLGGLREGDFSIRARGARPDDVLGLAMTEINALADTLHTQRLGAIEASALLRAVMDEIDVAVFAFDEGHRLRLVSRGGERLLGAAERGLLGRSAASLGLASSLEGNPDHTLHARFPGGAGPWQLHRGTFRQDGLAHQLVMLADVSRVLRDEERLAWQRLIRVLGHEINNSLAPITSIAGSLRALLARDALPADWREDAAGGLAVIQGRSESLGRFMAGYALLARLPAPRLAPVSVAEWVGRTAALETRVPVRVESGTPVTIMADPDQLEQLLINLVRNAADAAIETRGAVSISWEPEGGWLAVRVRDDGLGVSDTANLFVPFYTTKPGGSGIGLALSRQIAEAHGGTLTLANRQDARGGEATIRLPLHPPS